MPVMYSAEDFRKKLAGYASPEQRLTENEKAQMRSVAIMFIRVCKDLFGRDLDVKTVWERISNGLLACQSKSAGSAEKFITAMIDFIKSEQNAVMVNSRLDALRDVVAEMSPEMQRIFVKYCAENRMLLVTDARKEYVHEKSAQANASVPQDAGILLEVSANV